jgi:hypothetical protein
MHHQIFRADDQRTFQLASEGLNRVLAHYRSWSRQVNQIVAMYDQRREIVLRPGIGQQPDLQAVGCFRPPHARAGRKDLQRVRPKVVSVQRGAFQRAGRAGMNADSHPASITGG